MEGILIERLRIKVILLKLGLSFRGQKEWGVVKIRGRTSAVESYEN